MIQQIFDHDDYVPDSLKQGILTPVYKNKGSNKDAKITEALPLRQLSLRSLKFCLRTEFKMLFWSNNTHFNAVLQQQLPPMNGALLVEEYLRECKDQKKMAYIAFLDIKSAFDIVSHASLLRKLYNIGIEGQCWSLIHQLHHGA